MNILEWVKSIFTNNKTETIITLLDVTKIYKADQPFEMVLTDAKGTPLNEKDVVIKVNGVEYPRVTDKNGYAKLNINLNPGNYDVYCSFNGDGTYDGSKSYAKCTVSPNLSASDLTMSQGDGSKFVVKATDADKKPIVGCAVNIIVNGVTYERVTDSNGQAFLNINLNQGIYNIIAKSYNTTITKKITINAKVPDGAISFNEYTWLMNRVAWWLVKNNKSFKKRDVYGYFNKASKRDDLIATIKKRGDNVEADPLVSEFVECAIFDNPTNLEFLPSYVSAKNGTKYYKGSFVDMANRVSAYETLHKKSPNYVKIATATQTSDKNQEILKYFEKVFNKKVTDIDSALSILDSRGYAYYYNSRACVKKTIDNIKAGKGANCTDASILISRIALALGYEVKFYHVQCSTGGHVRLKLKHKVNTENTWIDRDPACCLSNNGKSIRCIWCSSAPVLGVDPAWIFKLIC